MVQSFKDFMITTLISRSTGLLTVMVVFTVRSLMANHQTRYRSPVLYTFLILIWALSTGHWITNVFRAYQAFVRFPAGPIAYYDTLNLPSYTARNVLYCTLVIVSDIFAVYRVYRVYNNNCQISVAGYGTTYYFATGSPGIVFDTPIVPWGTSWYAMNLSTNMMCTFLIAFKIIRSQRTVQRLSKVSSARLWNTLVIILESAAIYSSTLIMVMTTTLIGTNSAFTILDIGITFTLIILRVSLGVSSDTQYYGGMSTDATRFPSSRSGDLTVNVSRLVEVNGNPFSGTATAANGGNSAFTDDIKLDRVDHV
ncbi:hypothetical protein K438DRAFT_1789684 [Mycena galopus ATCC 62051]|nr:hypothetical protein K438DRAFT_1789684 [Mycena galopus ATCC 62051]